MHINNSVWINSLSRFNKTYLQTVDNHYNLATTHFAHTLVSLVFDLILKLDFESPFSVDMITQIKRLILDTALVSKTLAYSRSKKYFK